MSKLLGNGATRCPADRESYRVSGAQRRALRSKTETFACGARKARARRREYDGLKFFGSPESVLQMNAGAALCRLGE